MQDRAPETDAARLRSLTISDGKLSPAFAAATYQYTAAVGYDVAAITVGASASAGATVTIVPADADATTTGHQVALQVGENSIVVLVASPGATDTKIYFLDVIRASEADDEADEADEAEPLQFVDGIGTEPVLRITGALKDQARSANPQQPRGAQAQQPTLGLDPAAHLDAGQEVELTLTAYQGDQRGANLSPGGPCGSNGRARRDPFRARRV